MLLATASIGRAARTVVLLAHPITPQRRSQQIQPQKWFSSKKITAKKHRFLHPRTNAFLKPTATALSFKRENLVDGEVPACRLRPCAGAVAEGAWEKPRRPLHASLQPVPARRKSGARRACLAPDRDTLCTRTGGDARRHAAHGHGGASSVQERGRRGWVPTVCWWWRGGAPAEATRRSVPRLLCFVMDVARRGCVS